MLLVLLVGHFNRFSCSSRWRCCSDVRSNHVWPEQAVTRLAALDEVSWLLPDHELALEPPPLTTPFSVARDRREAKWSPRTNPSPRRHLDGPNLMPHTTPPRMRRPRGARHGGPWSVLPANPSSGSWRHSAGRNEWGRTSASSRSVSVLNSSPGLSSLLSWTRT